MRTIKISVPNDYNNEADTEKAVAECYDRDVDAAINDGFLACQERIASSAKEAGLTFSRGTDFGAEWTGTEAQCTKVREMLPAWAYVGEIENNEV